ncbi:MAG: TIGR04063 family PEP-CTERM/XrtA system glycosyltransferase [Thermodesulfobacteriota bacterium]|nr:TIGR04063 family PEP-CTERM/XrtA system glycosyltransferase [Thermodesulfobacteriota bacterium]
MKILHILDHSLPLHSGYTFRSHNIFLEQRKRGWKPVVVTSPKHEQSWKGDWTSREEINGFTYYRTGDVSASPVPFADEIRLIRALMKRIREVIEIEKPDILHAHSPVLNAIPALWMRHKLKIPVVYEIRAFWEDAAVDHGTYGENSLKYRMVRCLETWVCHKADQVAVLCKGLKKELIARGISSDKITVVYNGINPDDFSISEPDQSFINEWGLNGKKVIGFIGSFYRYEGLDLLIQAFSNISNKYPEAILLLVGGGEMHDQLNKLKELNKLQNRIIMPGRIPHDRIPGVYALVDILAYPRYSMRLTDLVTPLKPLEAMAMGKAFVASDVGGHKELIKHEQNGLLFSAGNIQALAETLERLLKDHDLRSALQAKEYSWVRMHHTWEKSTASQRELYAEALGN